MHRNAVVLTHVRTHARAHTHRDGHLQRLHVLVFRRACSSGGRAVQQHKRLDGGVRSSGRDGGRCCAGVSPQRFEGVRVLPDAHPACGGGGLQGGGSAWCSCKGETRPLNEQLARVTPQQAKTQLRRCCTAPRPSVSHVSPTDSRMRGCGALLPHPPHCPSPAAQHLARTLTPTSPLATQTTKAGGKASKAAAGDGSWDWDGAQRERLARTLFAALAVDLGSLFRGRAVDTSFLALFVTAASACAGSASGMKNKALRAAVGDAFVLTALRYGQLTLVGAALGHLLGRHEHVAAPLAEWCELAARKHNDTRLAQTLLKDIGAVPPSEYKRQAETDSVGVRNVCAFLVDLAERLPLTVGKNVSLLRPHLDGDAPQLRCALLSVVGHLVVGYSDRGAANPLAASGDGTAAGTAPATGASNQQSELRVAAKQGFLDVLFERVHDTNAFARARVLAVFSLLAEREVLGAPHFVACARVAAGRLQDTKSAVRKQAATCLRTLLEKNPFGPELALGPLQGSHAQWQQRLEDALAKERAAAETQELEAAEAEVRASQMEGIDEEGTPVEGDIAAATAPPAVAGADTGTTSGAADSAPWLAGGVEGLRAMVASLAAAVDFAAVFADSIPALTQLLASATASDCVDAIACLVTCRQFGVDAAAHVGIRAALRLVFSREQAARGAALEAAETLFLRQDPAGAAASLLELVHGATLGDLTAAEEVLTSLVTSGRLAPQGHVMRHLWAEAAGASSSASVAGGPVVHDWQRRCDAVTLLAMAGGASSDVVRPHVSILLDCLAAGARQYAPLARAACAALARAAPATTDGDSDTVSSSPLTRGRWPSDHAALEALAAVLRAPVNRGALSGAAWFPVAEQAVACIYARHPDPEAFCAAVLAHMAADAGLITAAAEGEAAASPTLSRINAASLARFLFALGCVALNQLVFIEGVAKAVRTARTAAEKRAAEAASNAASAPPAASAAASKGRGKKAAAAAASEPAAPAAADKTDEPGGLAAQLGQTSASADAELDAMREACEAQLVGSSSGGVVALFAPLAVGVASTPALLCAHPLLRGAALSCLCRLCALDATFCESQLALIFTLLRDTPAPGQRASCCVCLGDLAYRFPNAVEPWTAHLYGSPQWKTCLHDTQAGVRKHALGVLSHLVLNDMLKVRGNVADMARCLEDCDPQVAALARLFFHELAQRTGAPIYNLLPDVLSRLSSDAGLSEDGFARIMKHLLQFIDKDKQTDGLVDKLLARMPDAIAGGHVKQQRDITLCLASLALSDRGVKRLMDGWKLYEPALGDAQVAANLEAAVRGAKRAAKATGDAKAQLEEFEAKLRQAAEERADAASAAHRAETHEGRAQGPPPPGEEAPGGVPGADENAAPVAPPQIGGGKAGGKVSARRPAAKKAAAPARRKAASGRKAAASDSDGSDDGEENEEEPAVAVKTARAPLRPARGKAKAVVVEESDDDDA